MSKVEVNTIEPQCGTTLTVGKADTNVAVPSNVVKSNALQASDAGNIIKQCGTTITLGATGDSIALASGATQTGFGRTGTVDWVTTPKVTGDSPVTAATGSGYFLNTTAGVITINLPAGAAGSIVSIADYASTWASNNVTVSANGSEKIGGATHDSILSTNGQSVTLVYVDAAQGWVTTADSTENIVGAAYVAATGGSPCAGTTCGDYKIHVFTGPGTLCVSNAGTAPGNNKIDYLVVAGGAGGGSGGNGSGGGAGAGGFRESVPSPAAWTASPLANPAGGLIAAVQGYPIVVGGGGAGGSGNSCPNIGASGNTSSFDSITSAGGGGGGGGNPHSGADGGSGGGSKQCGVPAGGGNEPPVAPPQGNDGAIGSAGTSSRDAGGGGGGATTAGTAGANPGPAGPGGNGGTTEISGAALTKAGGGGGGKRSPAVPTVAGTGGPGGGGAGAYGAPDGTAGTVNTGGGGGGGGFAPAGAYGAGGLGGSGYVVIRYKFQ